MNHCCFLSFCVTLSPCFFFFFCTALAILASSVVQRDPLQLHKMHQMYQISPSLCWGNSEAHEDYELHKDKKKTHKSRSIIIFWPCADSSES